MQAYTGSIARGLCSGRIGDGGGGTKLSLVGHRKKFRRRKEFFLTPLSRILQKYSNSLKYS